MKSRFPLARTARTVRAAVAAAVCLATFALPAAAADHQPPAAQAAPAAKAAPVFVQTDNTRANTVVAYHRAPDGSLHRRATYATGGRGGALRGAVVDHLASQGSLTYDKRHRLLYAVNAGSDTVTVFGVHGEQLRRLQVISSGGSFPVSVTAHGDRVFVLNARNGGSVQGYRVANRHLALVRAWHRELRLNTSATPEFTHTPGQVAFTPDGSQLVVTTKAGGNSVAVFHIARGGAPSARPVVNSRRGSVPFGVVFDRQQRLVVADSGPNTVLTFHLRADGEVVLLDETATGQQASCWIVRSGNRFYTSNAGSDTVSRFLQYRDAHLRKLGDSPTGKGPVDSAVTPDGRYLYVQTGGRGAVDAFRIGTDGSLARIGSVTVPGAVGGEGIVAL